MRHKSLLAHTFIHFVTKCNSHNEQQHACDIKTMNWAFAPPNLDENSFETTTISEGVFRGAEVPVGAP